MEHHNLDAHPIPKDSKPLFINEPWMIDPSLQWRQDNGYDPAPTPFIPMGIVMFAACYGLGAIMGTGIVTLFSQILLGSVIYSILALSYFVLTKNQVILDMLVKVKKRK